MACLFESNTNNFIRLYKVQGTLSLSDLQTDGIPDFCELAEGFAPSLLVATPSTTVFSISLSWVNADNSIQIQILRSSTMGGPYTVIDTIAAGSVSYVDTGLDQETTYYYVVRYLGETDTSNEDSATTVYLFYGQAIRFADGVNDYAENSSVSGLSVDDFSCLVWFRLTAELVTTDQGTLFQMGDGVNTQMIMRCQRQDADTITLIAQGRAGTISTQLDYSPNDKIMVAMEYDRGAGSIGIFARSETDTSQSAFTKTSFLPLAASSPTFVRLSHPAGAVNIPNLDIFEATFVDGQIMNDSEALSLWNNGLAANIENIYNLSDMVRYRISESAGTTADDSGTNGSWGPFNLTLFNGAAFISL